MTLGIPDDELPIQQRDAEKTELETYVGIPKCPDCKWKLNTDITNFCPCRGGTDNDHDKHIAAFNRARELQRLIEPC